MAAGPGVVPATAGGSGARRARRMFLLAVALTAALYVLPYGRRAAWPLVLLSTLAHEMGHGLAAVAVGARFESLRLWPDASGQALWSGDVGRIGRALVALGGLVQPAVAALVGFTLGRGERRARALLVLAGAGLVGALVWVVRGWFAVAFVAVLAAAFLALGLTARAWLAQLAVVFLAVELALSVFSRGDYLFARWAETGAGRFPSDVAVMAEALFLPHWVWGGLGGAVSLAVLGIGLVALLGDERRQAASGLPGPPRKVDNGGGGKPA